MATKKDSSGSQDPVTGKGVATIRAQLAQASYDSKFQTGSEENEDKENKKFWDRLAAIRTGRETPQTEPTPAESEVSVNSSAQDGSRASDQVQESAGSGSLESSQENNISMLSVRTKGTS